MTMNGPEVECGLGLRKRSESAVSRSLPALVVALLAASGAGCTSTQMDALEEEMARIDAMPFFVHHVVPALSDGSEPIDPGRLEEEVAWWEAHAHEEPTNAHTPPQQRYLQLERAIEENPRASKEFIERVDRLNFFRHRIPEEEQDGAPYLRSMRLYRIADSVRRMHALLAPGEPPALPGAGVGEETSP
jgi:hypothetical protein